MVNCPDIPQFGIQFPTSDLIDVAFNFAKEYTDEATLNHTVRSAYWALIIARKHPVFVANPPDLELVVLAGILHDLGWSTTHPNVSKEKCFEADGANIARDFIRTHSPSTLEGGKWPEARLQRLWYAIALHTTQHVSIHAEPEVALTSMGIACDFFGPYAPFEPKGIITVDEYLAVRDLFPRAGFGLEATKKLFGAMCREKPETTYYNIVGEFGCKYGYDGNGEGREEFSKQVQEHQFSHVLISAMGALEKL